MEAFSETSQKDVLTVTLHGADVDFVLKAEKVTYPGWKAVLNEKEDQMKIRKLNFCSILKRVKTLEYLH